MLIDITGVDDLRRHIISDTVGVGANVNLTEFMDILTEVSKKPGFEYCELMVKHIDLVANVPVRNVSICRKQPLNLNTETTLNDVYQQF